jgi:hypothetical protein
MWFADIQPLSIDSFELTKTKWTPDLSTMLGLGEELAEEAEVWVPKTPRTAKAMPLTVPAQYAGDRTIAPGGVTALENPHAKHRLVMFHDSFGVFGSLREYLGEHFCRAVFVSGRLNARSLDWLVEQEHPDIVLEEIVERRLRDVPSDSSGDNE